VSKIDKKNRFSAHTTRNDLIAEGFNLQHSSAEEFLRAHPSTRSVARALRRQLHHSGDMTINRRTIYSAEGTAVSCVEPRRILRQCRVEVELNAMSRLVRELNHMTNRWDLNQYFSVIMKSFRTRLNVPVTQKNKQTKIKYGRITSFPSSTLTELRMSCETVNKKCRMFQKQIYNGTANVTTGWARLN
jgi:hypothetical protein